MSHPIRYRAALAQILVESGQPDRNLARAERAIDEAAQSGSRLVVLPECLDLGWTDLSARTLAEPIPGPRSDHLADAARRSAVHVAAGLVERCGERIYNSAILIDPDGRILLHHRKLNELDIALGLYDPGDRLAVVDTELGTLALAICADLFPDARPIAEALARMGAQVILSPCAWAVDSDHANARDPYGALWLDAYTRLARLYDLTVLGASNIGPITSGPWQGRKAIGCSLAIAPGGTILAHGPYATEALITVDLAPSPPIARGTAFSDALARRLS